ncbi:MAG: hypothetical protein LBF97_01675 [Elusimicrobiota bacterium]|jgi:DNA primase|nr:hypothetical protein [Elusimicrobiota bacterium]
MKIPEGLLRRYFESEFVVRKTTDIHEIRICSPFSDDKKYKLYINLKDGVYIDFKGGDSGSINKFLTHYLDIDESIVLSYLLKNFGLGSDFSKEEQEEIKKVYNYEDERKILEDVTWFKDTIGIYGKKALKYLKDRKIPQKYIDKWGYIFIQNSEYNE